MYRKTIGGRDFVDIGNAFAKIEFSVFRAVTAFDFDEGVGRLRVAFSTGEGDVLATHIESVEGQHGLEQGAATGVVPRALLSVEEVPAAE